MVGTLTREMAEQKVFAFSVDELLGYISKSPNLSLEIVKDKDSKKIFVTNNWWVTKRHQVGCSYSLDWSDYDMLRDSVYKITAKLGIHKKLITTQR